MNIVKILSKELSLPEDKITATVELLESGATIPFIARYRKEVTGSMDDETLRKLEERHTYLKELDARKQEVLRLIDEQGQLTEEIKAQLEEAQTLARIEDLYRPFRPKRHTRATAAIDAGLKPLADLLRDADTVYDKSVEQIAQEYLNPEKGIETTEQALAGACDIIAADYSDDPEIRATVRSYHEAATTVTTEKTGEDEKGRYEMYYAFSQQLSRIPPHRVLAMNRAENEGVIKVNFEAPTEPLLRKMERDLPGKETSPARPYLSGAVRDGYDRLILPSINRELRTELTDRACESALVLFADNLRHLLMQPPVKGHTVLGMDPGYRNGCKLAVVDPTGKVLDTSVIYPVKPFERTEQSAKEVNRLIDRHGVTLIALGNGTASRETEIFLTDTIRSRAGQVKYIVVDESGASVYSASELGAKEFPDMDVTLRSAVSLARRIQDPLAELVKIDPKSVGVGQYQHDMKPARLSKALDGVVEDCVNRVGVDLNTASAPLLARVAGISGTVAANIVSYREENGPFPSRRALIKVPRLGEKVFQQCAGFLRISESKEPLDKTGIHPEAYDAAKSLLTRFGCTAKDIGTEKIKQLVTDARAYGIPKLAGELGIGAPTLSDILTELEKPGRDPRTSLPAPNFRADLLSPADLTPGMILPGTVRNVTDFGAFVDIGVHRDGLIHISEMSNSFIKHPSEVLSVGDPVTVRVISSDAKTGRIALSLKQ